MLLQVDRHHIAEWSRRLEKCLHGGAIRQERLESVTPLAPTITPELVSGSVFFLCLARRIRRCDER